MENEASRAELTDSGFNKLADCDMWIDYDRRTAEIMIDEPLPDEDVVIIRTNLEKVIACVSEKVAGSVLGNLGTARFFGGH